MSEEQPNLAEMFKAMARAFADPGDWDCTAYEKGAREVGALCFCAPRGERDCWTLEQCRERMTGERQRVFDAIREKAAAGDPHAQYLARVFTSPDQLLNGEQPQFPEEGGDE